MTADSPRDYSPEAEGVRDCCANLAMTLRAVADGPAYPEDDELRGWASRLERAVRRMDEEKASRA